MIRITNSRQHWFDLTLSLSVLGISCVFHFFTEVFSCFFFLLFFSPGLQLERFPLLEKLPLVFLVNFGVKKTSKRNTRSHKACDLFRDVVVISKIKKVGDVFYPYSHYKFYITVHTCFFSSWSSS